MCFELGKMFPRLQRDGGRVNLKVFTKRIAVNADAVTRLSVRRWKDVKQRRIHGGEPAAVWVDHQL